MSSEQFDIDPIPESYALFKAKYDGSCAYCREKFYEGDPVGYGEDAVLLCKPCLLEEQNK